METQQNDISGMGEINENYNFWVKTDTFWSKKGQKRAKKIFVKTFSG